MPRLRILYAAPANDLVLDSGCARHVLSVAEGLAPEADVTVAFRRVSSEAAAALPAGVRLETIAGAGAGRSGAGGVEADGVAIRGLDPLAH
ncbi:MAG TPA: hypothetical protein VHF22_07890, partial [Planctomycetota bacterium]|nr:hypothetical protein [Planctomycetota bacterium]